MEENFDTIITDMNIDDVKDMFNEDIVLPEIILEKPTNHDYIEGCVSYGTN